MVIKTITAENQFSNSIEISADYFNVSIWGTFVATITVLRKFDDITWLDVETFTSAGEWIGLEAEGCEYRIGVKTGDFTSGTVNVRIGK